jgi:sugar phosphate isomerase/epimerase
MASPRQVRPQELKKIIGDAGLGVVGHTAYYLPLGNPFNSLRQAAVAELRRCVEVFAEVGVRWMNVHPDAYAPMHDRIFSIERNVESLRELLAFGRQLGVGIMIENLPGQFNTAEQLADLLAPLPQLGLHLDIGHANLDVERNTTPSILAAHGARVRHVHLHDNKGGRADLHLPLGAGTLDLPARIRELKGSGYDGTITLEVFSPDDHYLSYSRDVLRRLWDAAP